MKNLRDGLGIILLSAITYVLLVSVILPASKEQVRYENDKLFTNLYKNTSESVVSVTAAGGSGSGVFVTKDLVLTNAHVVDDASNFLVNVKIDDQYVFGLNVAGKVIFTDLENDIALVRIDEAVGKPVKFGNSLYANIGDQVYSIGSPNGLYNALGVGYVTGKHRVLPLPPHINILQVSTGVIGGQSGGGLFNIEGELIGITYAAIASADNFGFAITINAIKDVLKDYKDEIGF